MNKLSKVTIHNIFERCLDSIKKKQGKLGKLMCIMAPNKEQICFLSAKNTPQKNCEEIVDFMNKNGFSYFVTAPEVNQMGEKLPTAVICYKSRAIAEEFIVYYDESEADSFLEAAKTLGKF